MENPINDRITFEKFLGPPLDKASPDHSTFFLFLSRLSKEAMTQINNNILEHFTSKGLSINESWL
jgi:IS5 family transposase